MLKIHASSSLTPMQAFKAWVWGYCSSACTRATQQRVRLYCIFVYIVNMTILQWGVQQNSKVCSAIWELIARVRHVLISIISLQTALSITLHVATMYAASRDWGYTELVVGGQEVTLSSSNEWSLSFLLLKLLAKPVKEGSWMTTHWSRDLCILTGREGPHSHIFYVALTKTHTCRVITWRMLDIDVGRGHPWSYIA